MTFIILAATIINAKNQSSGWPVMCNLHCLTGSSARALIRFLIALLLVVAALSKGYSLLLSMELATSPLDFVIGGVAVCCELLLGVAYAVGLYPRLVSPVVLMCFAFFSVVSLASGIAGESSCGCFGRLSPSPWLMFVVDLVVAGLVWLHISRLDLNVAALFIGSVRICIVVVLIFGLFFGAVKLLRSRPNLDPEEWVGLQFPLLAQIDIRERIGVGDWQVVLIRSGCEKCKSKVRRISDDARHSSVADIAVVAIDGVPLDPFDFGGQSVCGRLSLSPSHLPSPIVVTLRNGRVLDVVVD